MVSAQIEYNSPSQYYKPGDTVTAIVTLKTDKPTLIKCVRCKGFATISPDGWRSNKEIEYHNSLLWETSEALNKTIVGEYTNNIQFKLPNDCLPSNHGKSNGSVKYSVQLTIYQPWRIPKKVTVPFYVYHQTTNEFDELPITKTIKKEVESQRALGSIQMSVTIPKSNYSIGETATILIHIDNNSEKIVKKVGWKLVQLGRFHKDGGMYGVNTSYTHDDVSSGNIALNIAPSTSIQFEHPIDIQSNGPTFDYDDYRLHIEHKFKFNLELDRLIMPIQLEIRFDDIIINVDPSIMKNTIRYMGATAPMDEELPTYHEACKNQMSLP